MLKVDLILQGPIYSFTKEIVNHYQSIKEIDQVILSCWDSDNFQELSTLVSNTIVSRLSMPKVGCGNVNLQIQTSLAGIKSSNADIILKIRTDMQIHEDDIKNLILLLINRGTSSNLCKLDQTYAKGKIIVGSIFTQFPYHPRDHFYVGYKEDMMCLFDIPFSSQDFLIPDTVQGIRPEAYIGSYYFSKFFLDSLSHVTNPHLYITDLAPKRKEALNISQKYMNDLFLPSPCVRHIWKKHGIYNYSPLWSPTYQEYWSKSW